MPVTTSLTANRWTAMTYNNTIRPTYAKHAPEMFVENGTHDRTVDLWSSGPLEFRIF